MKHVLLIITFLTYLPLAAQIPVIWVVEKSSVLSIKGKSNVNSFTCSVLVNGQNDTITWDNSSLDHSLSGSIGINVTNFNCHNKMLEKDLCKTLKADKYPEMFIRFMSLQVMPQVTDKMQLKGSVEVELAGVNKKFELIYTLIKATSGNLQMTSSKQFSFSDFNLVAPKKIKGLIKVKDQFQVNFELLLRQV